MNYDKMLKDITDATALRGVIDNVAQDLSGIESQIEGNKREIAKRQSLEEANESLELRRKEVAKVLKQHQDEMEKRMAELAKAGVTLPIDVKPNAVVHR